MDKLNSRYNMAKDKDVGKSDVADVMWRTEMQGCMDFSRWDMQGCRFRYTRCGWIKFTSLDLDS